jgi:hypothetical protein
MTALEFPNRVTSSGSYFELHWYEAAGIGRKEFKIKHLL